MLLLYQIIGLISLGLMRAFLYMKWVVSFILSFFLNLSLGVALAVSTYEGKKLKDKNEVLNEKYWDVEQEKIEVSEEYQRLQAKLEKSEAAVSRLKDLLRTASAKLNE